MDLKLDPITHDLAFDDNGDLTLVDGVERIVQQSKIRLRTFRGEWFADERVGMPYYQRILGVKPLRKAVVVADIRAAELGVSGVRDVYDIVFDYDATTRTASVTFRAVTTDGEPITFDDPFVLG